MRLVGVVSFVGFFGIASCGDDANEAAATGGRAGRAGASGADGGMNVVATGGTSGGAGGTPGGFRGESGGASGGSGTSGASPDAGTGGIEPSAGAGGDAGASAGAAGGDGGSGGEAGGSGGEAGGSSEAVIVPDSDPESELGDFGCQLPATVAQILVEDTPTFQLAVAGGFLYFMEYSGLANEPGAIGRIRVAGGRVEYVVEGLSSQGPVAATETSLFFFGNTGLVRKPIEGGETELLDPLGRRLLAVTEDDHAFWLSESGSEFTFKTHPSFGGPAPAVLPSDALNPVLSLAANGSDLYFTDYAGAFGSVAMDTGEIRIFPRTDYAPAESLAVNADAAFYAARAEEYGTSVIIRASLDGAERRIIARGGGGGGAGIAVDDGFVYFVDRDVTGIEPLACIKKKPLAGGPPSTVAVWPSYYGFGLTLDQTHVYVSDGSTILRAPK